MSEDGHPKSSATRGGGDPSWDRPYQRCVDCPQFESLGGRVTNLEASSLDISKRLGVVERKQDDHGRRLERMDESIGRVVRWLDGANGTDGFRVEWALLSTGIKKGISIRERIAWAVGGLLGAAMLGLLGKLLIDAIQRGIAP